MAPITPGLFDEIEFEAARSGDHAAAARRMAGLAEAARPHGEISRAELFVRAGEQWQMAEDHHAAIESFQAALDDGGPTWVDPRACIVGSLLRLGHDTEAEQLIEAIRVDKPRDPKVHHWLAEDLMGINNLRGALEWATAGVEVCLNGERVDDSDLRMLLRLRYRIRNDLGLTEDRYDRMLDEIELEDREAPDPDTRGVRAVGVLFWPDRELTEVLRTWPALAAPYGEDYPTHRAVTEHKLREMARAGYPGLRVVAGTLAEYLEFAQARGLGPQEAATRAQYGADLAAKGRGVPWPPARGEACWCGSGAIYALCCRRLTR